MIHKAYMDVYAANYIKFIFTTCMTIDIYFIICLYVYNKPTGHPTSAEVEPTIIIWVQRLSSVMGFSHQTSSNVGKYIIGQTDGIYTCMNTLLIKVIEN